LFGFDFNEADRANAGLHKTIWNLKCRWVPLVNASNSVLKTGLVSLLKWWSRLHRRCYS